MFGESKHTVELTVSARTILRIIGIIVATIVIINFLKNILHPLTLIFVSFFLALALNPVVTGVSRRLKNRSRTRATALSYIAVISVLIAFFSLILPPLINQTTKFIRDIPTTLRALEDDNGAVGSFVRRYELQDQVIQIANDWSQDTSRVTDQAVTTANRVISNLISIITVLILTFMMLVEGPKWLALFWQQLPKDKSVRGKKLAHRMNAVVSGYVNGQVVVAAIGAFFATIALLIATSILNVTTVNPIALGGIVFLFGLIPTIGVIISTSVVVLFSLFSSVPLALTMLVFFVIYQQVENASVQPYIQSRANELTPLIVFVSAIVGIGFGGILGAIIAIPVAGCIKVIIDEFAQEQEETN